MASEKLLILQKGLFIFIFFVIGLYTQHLIHSKSFFIN